MKWIVRILLGALGVVALIGVIGMVLPERHVAAIRMDLPQPPVRVFTVISDVSGGTAWRSDLDAVEVLSAAGEPLRWRERTGSDAITMAMEESDPPGRMVSRIDDPGLPFGGRWIYELAPSPNGTTLTITEEGEVSNPFFRFMSRFVFGHYHTLEGYGRDLARYLGARVEPVRVAKSE